MKYLLLLLLASTARAAPFVQYQDLAFSLHQSSFSYNFTAQTTAATLTTCYSTVTVNIPAGSTMPIHVSYVGPVTMSVANEAVGIGFLIDGGYDTNWSATKTPWVYSGGGTLPNSVHSEWTTNATYSGGNHTVCMTLAVGINDTAKACASVAAYEAFSFVCEFGAYPWK